MFIAYLIDGENIRPFEEVDFTRYFGIDEELGGEEEDAKEHEIQSSAQAPSKNREGPISNTEAPTNGATNTKKVQTSTTQIEKSIYDH